MTKTIQKTSIITTASIAILLGGIFLLSDEMKFAEAGVIGGPPPPPSSICPEDGTVQHWDKIIFQLNEIHEPRPDPPGGDDPPPPEPSSPYFDTPLDLKILDPPGQVVILRDEIINHLPEDIQALSDKFVVEIIDVRYETIACVKEGPIGGQGDRGPQGPQGPKGDPGSASSQDIIVRAISDEDTDISKTKTLKVECGANEVVTGGGYGASPNMHVLYNGPSPKDSNNPTGWLAIGVKENGPTGSMSVHVICAKLVP